MTAMVNLRGGNLKLARHFNVDALSVVLVLFSSIDKYNLSAVKSAKWWLESMVLLVSLSIITDIIAICSLHLLIRTVKDT